MSKIISIPRVYNGYDHYHKNGNLVGYSIKRFFGGLIHYEADGNYAGSFLCFIKKGVK